MRLLACFLLGIIALPLAQPCHAQVPTRVDSTLNAIAREALTSSQLPLLAQALLDSIGPRLTGSPNLQRAGDWVAAAYRRWGMSVSAEQYGTARAWERGIFHVDLLAPHVRSLEGMLMAFSVGTDKPIEAPVIVLPAVSNRSELEAWLPQARGKFVALSLPEPTCRPDENWQVFAPELLDSMRAARVAALRGWSAGRRASGLSGEELQLRLAQAGARGLLVSLRSNPTASPGWGTSKVGTASNDQVPEIGLSCEDYGLVARLAAKRQGPVIRVDAPARLGADVPVFNVIAELRGRAKPNEYVVLSAHLDSWDAGTGATDNGSGTVVMMEAMRILKAVYPHPKRTILVAHWGGEEQGLQGSRAFAATHGSVVNGLQALFNQDSGTGRIVSISLSGNTDARAFFRRWLSQLPPGFARNITIEDGSRGGGSDQLAFVCRRAPAFSLESLKWDYETYTWHTNRDTFDKLVFEDLQRNAALVAMLAFQASEDPQTLPRGSGTMCK
jgi:hypothetical protein